MEEKAVKALIEPTNVRYNTQNVNGLQLKKEVKLHYVRPTEG